jgi:opacity protein-like surface antigen
MNKLFPSLCAAALLAAQVTVVRAADENGEKALDKPLFQIFLGVLELDDQTGQWDEIYDGDVDVDFSSLPGAGMEGEYVYYQGWVHVGLNPGGSFAWKNDDTKFSGGYTNETGGVLRIEVDNSLLLAELHLGGYVRGRLSDRITSYVAAGPMLMYGYHDADNDSVDDSVAFDNSDSSDVNVGYYARAGIDFAINNKQHLGLGVRYMSTELDFDKTVGNIDIEGPQYVLTFSTSL